MLLRISRFDLAVNWPDYVSINKCFKRNRLEQRNVSAEIALFRGRHFFSLDP